MKFNDGDWPARGRDAARVFFQAPKLLSWRGKPAEEEGLERGLLDPVTGLPTRRALEIAAGELEDRSLVERRPIAVARLHLRGVDAEVGEELVDAVTRAQVPLRAYDRLFSVGGADLVLLLPGGETADAVEVVTGMQAEVKPSSNRAYREELIAGISSSMSGEPFVFESILAKAEQALDDTRDRGGLVVRPNLHTESFGSED